jgi:hypothetical protein
MATWTTLPDAALEPGKPIRSIDGLALRDNPVAITEGAAGAPKMQTNGITDGAVTTAKLAANERMTTANVLNATAGASVGAVGTYAFLGDARNVVTNEGGTVAGSNLRYSSRAGVVGATPSGTWQAMGRSTQANFDPYGGLSSLNPTVFLRIS